MYLGPQKSQLRIFVVLAILIVISLIAGGCTSATSLPTQTPDPAGMQVAVASTLTNTPLPSPTFTYTPLPSVTPTATPTLLPTSTSRPTLTPNLRYPPAVLILHSNSNMAVNPDAKTLDNVKFLKEFLPLLKDSPFTVTTFEALEKDPDIKNPLIILIDQFYWGKILTDQDMHTFELLDDAGYVGVITIVPVPIRRFDNNALIGEYIKKGWEVANNTDEYKSLEGKHWFDVRAQVNTGGARMSASIVVGRDQFPITLVPPYGKFSESLYEAIKETYVVGGDKYLTKWIVADVPDKTYDITELTSTVGFMEASSDAKATFDSLVQRFVH